VDIERRPWLVAWYSGGVVVVVVVMRLLGSMGHSQRCVEWEGETREHVHGPPMHVNTDFTLRS